MEKVAKLEREVVRLEQEVILMTIERGNTHKKVRPHITRIQSTSMQGIVLQITAHWQSLTNCLCDIDWTIEWEFECD